LKNIPALTGIRFVAAFIVFFSHYPLEQLAKPIFPFAEQGYSGVTLFFVLSGFIICINYFDRFNTDFLHELPHFFVARFARLYPLYCITVLYDWFAQKRHLNPVPHLLAIQSWYPDIGVSMGINGPTWSVSVELFLYLFFPILVLYASIAHLEKSRVRLFITGILIVLVMYVLAQYYSSPSFNALPLADTNSSHRWLYRNPATRVFDFLLGGLAGIWYLKHFSVRRENPARIWSLITYAALIAIVAVMSSTKLFYSAFSWDFAIALPGLLLIVGLACNPNTQISRFLSCRLMVTLGELSYAFYLIHVPMRFLYKGVTGNALNDITNFFFFLFLVILLAYSLHKLLELPLRKRIMHVYSTWHPSKDNKMTNA
jgi:peptidoglycan/LPS O-acetylase OafA/YrhL